MIDIQNLLFGYSKKSELFHQLTMQVGEGNIVGLLGKNGAGKSTLLKIISGALFAKEGEISVFGKKPHLRQPSFLEELYYVPEELALPAVKMDAFVAAAAPLYPNFNFGKMDRIMQQFELVGSMKINKVSYGQKKKFLIAFALSTQCKLLILDEPTNGLDIPSKALFRKVVAGSLSDEQSVLISTHQVKDVENLIDKVMVIEKGEIVLNRSLYDISCDFAFTDASARDIDHALYHEEVPGGYRMIVPATEGKTDVDIEILFNAVTNGVNLN